MTATQHRHIQTTLLDTSSPSTAEWSSQLFTLLLSVA